MREPLPPLAWAVSHWAEDPWAGGAWSGLLVGGTAADRARLGEPVGDRLVVAGEAVHSTWPAMAHGAYGSGVAAAERTDALARPGERMVVVGNVRPSDPGDVDRAAELLVELTGNQATIDRDIRLISVPMPDPAWLPVAVRRLDEASITLVDLACADPAWMRCS